MFKSFGIQRRVRSQKNKEAKVLATIKKGQRFRTTRELKIKGIIIYGAPCSGGFSGTLPSGEILILGYDPKSWAKAFWLKPERYKYFEHIFIDEKILRNSEYDSYAISASVVELMQDYEIVIGS